MSNMKWVVPAAGRTIGVNVSIESLPSNEIELRITGVGGPGGSRLAVLQPAAAKRLANALLRFAKIAKK